MDLKTNRTKLRQWAKADYPKFAELNADDRTLELFPKRLTTTESNKLADELAGLIDKRGWGLWVLEETESEEFMGFVGLHEVPPEMDFAPAIEIGWRLHHPYWGKGYATEAAKEVLRFAFDELQLPEIVSFTSVLNHRSIRVMEKIGLQNTQQNFMHPKIEPGHPLSEHVLYKRSTSADRDGPN